MPTTSIHHPTPAGRRRSLASLVAGMVLALIAAVGGAPAPAAAYDEGAIVALANDARAANGLGGLVRNGALDAVALSWANQMAASGTLSHNAAVGAQIPGGWNRWGENVAQGYGSGSAVHEGWMNSPGHRANIVGDFTDIGVALISAGGTTWAVQVFATYPGSGLPAPAPAAPAPDPAPPAAAPAPAPAEPQPAAPAAQPSETAPAPTPTPTPTASPTAEPAPTATRPTHSIPVADAAGDHPAAAPIASASSVPLWPWLVGVLVVGLVVGVLIPLSRRLRR